MFFIKHVLKYTWLYIFIEIAAIIYLPFHWTAINLSLQYRSQVNIEASTHMWRNQYALRSKLISYSGRLRNSRDFEILCQDSISSLSLVLKSSALCPHLHRTLGPRNKVRGNFICFWSVKMHLFPFINYEMGSLFFLAYKHIIRKFVIFSSGH